MGLRLVELAVVDAPKAAPFVYALYGAGLAKALVFFDPDKGLEYARRLGRTCTVVAQEEALQEISVVQGPVACEDVRVIMGQGA